jgi:hypothetical protein
MSTKQRLKNKLLSLGKIVLDRSICRLVLNGLRKSYESVVQTLSNLDIVLTFDQLIGKLLAEVACQKQQTSQLGDEKALAIHFNQAVRNIVPERF